MEQFKDRVAIVTGGGSGIGRGISAELAARGARVIVADINAAGAEETADAIRTAGGSARAARLDVTVADEVRSIVERTASEFGRLDYMFNNAGIGLTGRFEDVEPHHWKRILDVNLWGVIHGSLYAYRIMLKQGSGHIVNVASLAGLAPATGAQYATTKYGVVGLTLSLRIEAALNGIRASVACPGLIRTPIWDTSVDVSNQFTDEEKNAFLSRFTMAGPEECARTILKGVAKNRAIIPVTTLAWTFWRLNRLFPEFFVKTAIKQTKKFFIRRAAGKQ